MTFTRPGLLVVLLAAAPTLASSNYPGAMQSHLGGGAPFPSCTVCHASNAGGFGTVTKAAGITLMDQGMVAGDLASLTAALDAVEAAGTDSDSGGTGDVDELRAGTDPNDGTDDGTDPGPGGGGDQLQYGFGCSAAGSSVGTIGALALLVLGLRRRRARA